jgi:hypothetical protein
VPTVDLLRLKCPPTTDFHGDFRDYDVSVEDYGSRSIKSSKYEMIRGEAGEVHNCGSGSHAP